MIRGSVDESRIIHRSICYCQDCQAFARFLGRAADILDERGGSDVVQILPMSIRFTHGLERLECMRLTPKGLLRWYAGCCKTPLGNTLWSRKFSFIGLLHSCLESDRSSLDEAFGPVRSLVHTQGAMGGPKPRTVGQGVMVRNILLAMFLARLSGNYRRNRLFDDATGAPIASPRILTANERAALMQTGP